nr:plant organelle RNA recognition domain-containing protein [Tanacetum cinerariifolium]
GLSILSKPGDTVFEVLAFLAFLSLLCCAVIGLCMLVYFPIADSLALKNLQDIEDRRRIIEEYNDTLSLIANQSPLDEVSGRNSVASAKQGSISAEVLKFFLLKLKNWLPGTLGLYSDSPFSKRDRLNDDGYESDSSDESLEMKLTSKIPFSVRRYEKRTSLQKKCTENEMVSHENWVTVRS